MNGSNIDDARADAFFRWPPEPYCLGCRHYRSINGKSASVFICDSVIVSDSRFML